MPIDMAVEEPRSRIVREEPDRDFVSRVTHTYDISNDRIVEVVGRISCAPDYMEIMPVQVDWVLLTRQTSDGRYSNHTFRTLTGPPAAPPGMTSSTLLFRSRP
jgi:hypothetical protein